MGGGDCAVGEQRLQGGSVDTKGQGTSSPLQELLVGLRAMITGRAQSTGV